MRVGFVALIGAVLLGGCDGAGSKPEDPFKTLTFVEFAFTPTDANFVELSVTSRRRAATNSFTTEGRLVLEPGTYRVRINARDREGPVPKYMSTAGSGRARLYYGIDSSLASRLALRPLAPHLRPLNAEEASFAPPKTTPALGYGFRLTVADTTGATGAVRLRMARFEESPGQTSGPPDHVDFDLRLPIRTVPSVR